MRPFRGCSGSNTGELGWGRRSLRRGGPLPAPERRLLSPAGGVPALGEDFPHPWEAHPHSGERLPHLEAVRSQMEESAPHLGERLRQLRESGRHLGEVGSQMEGGAPRVREVSVHRYQLAKRRNLAHNDSGLRPAAAREVHHNENCTDLRNLFLLRSRTLRPYSATVQARTRIVRPLRAEAGSGLVFADQLIRSRVRRSTILRRGSLHSHHIIYCWWPCAASTV